MPLLLPYSSLPHAGEGVSDYKDVAPELGSMEDWDALAKTLKENNMKVKAVIYIKSSVCLLSVLQEIRY